MENNGAVSVSGFLAIPPVNNANLDLSSRIFVDVKCRFRVEMYLILDARYEAGTMPTMRMENNCVVSVVGF